MLNSQKVISELSLVPFGSKGWMCSDSLECPSCHKIGKFGIRLDNSGGVTHCFYCEYTSSIYRYLKDIGRRDLINTERSVSISRSLVKPDFGVDKMDAVEDTETSLPRGFERIYYDRYLSDRNFRSYQYEQFDVGVTNHPLESRLHNYLIFCLYQRGKLVGWIARSKFSKEWHKTNLERYKQGLERLRLRYINSTGTDFDRILGGFDEITDDTKEVIIVEGLFDKTNVSQLLRTHDSDSLKVVFTFGNKVSRHQIELLRSTHVEKITLMYDPGTIKQSKRYSLELSRWFDVSVCWIDDENIDPGEIDLEYLTTILNNKKNFLYFYQSRMNFDIR